jgi:CheY-like chemotaxis protein
MTASGLRVLIIEDDRPLGLMLSQAIEADGHEVQLAYDAPSAFAACERFNPNVVLIDIGLPGIDGYSLAEQLRERACADGIRIAAVTGAALPVHRDRSRIAGFDRHITKPVDLGELARLLAVWADEFEESNANRR